MRKLGKLVALIVLTVVILGVAGFFSVADWKRDRALSQQYDDLSQTYDKLQGELVGYQKLEVEFSQLKQRVEWLQKVRGEELAQSMRVDEGRLAAYATLKGLRKINQTTITWLSKVRGEESAQCLKSRLNLFNIIQQMPDEGEEWREKVAAWAKRVSLDITKGP